MISLLISFLKLNYKGAKNNLNPGFLYGQPTLKFCLPETLFYNHGNLLVGRRYVRACTYQARE